MTSKVEPSENYWTIDVKMTFKVQPAADYWTIDRENLFENVFCSAVIFQIQQNVSPLKLNLCVGIV